MLSGWSPELRVGGLDEPYAPRAHPRLSLGQLSRFLRHRRFQKLHGNAFPGDLQGKVELSKAIPL